MVVMMVVVMVVVVVVVEGWEGMCARGRLFKKIEAAFEVSRGT